MRLLGIGAHRLDEQSNNETSHEVTINGRGKTETVAAGEDGIGWYEPGGRAFPEICVDPFF